MPRLDRATHKPSERIRRRAVETPAATLASPDKPARTTGGPGPATDRETEIDDGKPRKLVGGRRVTTPVAGKAGSSGSLFSTLVAEKSKSGTTVVDPAEQQRLDKQPLRSYVLDDVAPPHLVGRAKQHHLKPPPPGAFKDFRGPALGAALENAARLRLARLKESPAAAVNPRVCPEDGSLRVRNMHMAMIGMDAAGDRFVVQLAQIGRLEGFNVVTRVPEGAGDDARKHFAKLGLDNVVIVEAAGRGDFWSEDQGEFDVAGNVRVPAPDTDYDAMQLAILRERVKRLHPRAGDIKTRSLTKLRDKIRSDFADAGYSMPGRVAFDHSFEVVAGLALAKGSELRACRSHIEGGNLLVGTLADGTGYALVGRDSVAATRAVLQRDLKHAISDDDVHAAIADDLGIAASQVHFVEQPGEFHIDMWMAPIKPGEIVLDDAREAARLYVAWEREDYLKDKPKPPPPGATPAKQEQYRSDLVFWKSLGEDREETVKQILEQAEQRAKFEERVAQDLERAGLKVHRMAGVFKAGWNMTMNFLNAEQGTNARGERYYVTLGGDPRAERYFVDRFRQLDTGISRVHFLDREFTPGTLGAQGGISCRVKSEGDLA